MNLFYINKINFYNGSIQERHVSGIISQEEQLMLQGMQISPYFNSFYLHLKHLLFSKSQISSSAQESLQVPSVLR
jgi:hypothetical protein